MKRFCLLLLAFVLPLQMSWAATHVCAEQVRPAHGGTAVHSIEMHQVIAESVRDHADGGGSSADFCCTAAHACHGLHSMMGADTAVPQFLKQSQHAATPPPQLCGFDAVARIERPQWAAA